MSLSNKHHTTLHFIILKQQCSQITPTIYRQVNNFLLNPFLINTTNSNSLALKSLSNTDKDVRENNRDNKQNKINACFNSRTISTKINNKGTKTP